MPRALADLATDGPAAIQPGFLPWHGRRLIPNRQLAALFAYSLVNWSVGNGLLPLLPKYAEGLGAPPWLVGIYLGIAYAAIAVGSALAGWLADRLGHRRALMIGVVLGIPPILLAMSQVADFVVAVVATATVWFLAGMALAFANILAGLGADARDRGRILGFLGMAAPVGSILGGLGIGVLTDRLGFSGLWVTLGLLYLVCPAVGVLVRDVAGPVESAVPRRAPSRNIWSAAFLILIAGSLLAAFGSFISALGRTFVMQRTFTNAELTSTVTASGLVTLPFPLLIGFLSDRLGRLRFLALCYAAGTAGLVVYSGAAVLWQFWLAAALVAFVSYVSTAVGSALVVDLTPREAVGRGLAVYSAIGWAGGILGFALGGYLFSALGASAFFLLGALLLAIAILLLPPVGRALRSRLPEAERLAGPELAARKG